MVFMWSVTEKGVAWATQVNSRTQRRKLTWRMSLQSSPQTFQGLRHYQEEQAMVVKGMRTTTVVVSDHPLAMSIG